MHWEAAPLFATLLIKIRVPETEWLRDYFHAYIKDVVDARDNSKDGLGKLSHYHSRGGLFEHHPELAHFQMTLEEIGSFVYKDLMNYTESGEIRLTQAWFNFCELGGAQSAHKHTNSLLPGTVYLHADEHTRLDFSSLGRTFTSCGAS